MVGFNLGERITPKIHVNIGALLDLPTGILITGIKGETFHQRRAWSNYRTYRYWK